MPQPESYTRVAKLAVTALVKTPDAAEAVAHGAIDRLFGWLQGGEHERLIRRVADGLAPLAEAEFGGAARLGEAVGQAEVLFERFGLSAAELVECCLEPRLADDLLLDEERGGRVLRDADPAVAALCREHIVPRVHQALLDDPDALEKLRPAVLRALLHQGEAIRAQPPETARALQALTAEALLANPIRYLWPGAPPTAFVRAEYGVVPFHAARAGLVDELVGWCEAPGPSRVLLVVGAGGMGKTRLAIELCRRMRAASWRNGFLDKDAPADQPWVLDALLRGGPDLLVVVDYAETRRDLLAALLRRLHPGRRGGKVRVVLLARALGDWWRELQTADADIELVLDAGNVAVTELAPLAPTVPERERAFAEAAAAFARALKCPAPARAVPGIGAPPFETVLYLHVAALLAVLGDRDGDGAGVLGRLLGRERRHWRSGLKAEGLNERTLAAPFGQAAALLTLAGAVGEGEAAAWLRRVPALADQANADLLALARLLRRLYPGEEGLSGVRPDLLGEELVDQELADEERRGEAVLLDAAFADAAEGRIAKALTVLARLARRRPAAARWLERAFARHLERTAEPAIGVAIEIGDPIGELLADVVKGRPITTSEEFERAYQLMERLPLHTVALRRLRVVVTEQCLGVLRVMKEPDENRLAEIAHILNNLSAYRAELGQRERALAAAAEAAGLYRKLTVARPDAFQASLAGTLNNLATTLSDLGRREEALAAAAEAAGLYRALAVARPEAFRPDLAMALTNLATTLSALGRQEKALAAADEAAALYRALTVARPDAFRPYLASALTGLAAHLSELGRREAALVVAEEAVALRRELVPLRPDAFRPDLAMSLHNLAITLSAVGRREGALAAAHEAAALYRELATARPDAFRPNLAVALNNLATMLSEVGRREEALAVAEETVALRRDLASSRPDAFRPNLAGSLSNLANRLSEVGRREAALAAAQEAVALWRELVVMRPDALRPDLALSLAVLTGCLEAVGRDEEALGANAEAIATLSASFRALPQAYAHRIGPMVRRYLERCRKLGREPDGELLGPVVEAFQRMRGGGGEGGGSG